MEMWIFAEESVNSASRTILLAFSGFAAGPSHLTHPETVKFPEVCFLRMVSMLVAPVGAAGWKGNWIVCEGASCMIVPLFKKIMPLVVTCKLVSITGCCAFSLSRNNWCLDACPFWNITLIILTSSAAICRSRSKYKFCDWFRLCWIS